MTDAVSIVGQGKLGSPVAAAIADSGRQVIAVDLNPDVVAAINEGRPPVFEPGLAELFDRVGGRLRATTDCREAVRGSSITFVLVPTPSDGRSAFALDYAAAAFRAIGRALREVDRYHLVVLMSTVLPGATRHGLIPVIEQASGKRAGVDFGVCYSPEFVAIGSVIRDFTRPDFVLIGEHEEHAGAVLAEFFKTMLPHDPPVARMSLENAELTKISLNTYVTTKIAFANILASICEQIPGGDVDAVTRALGLDRRISPHYLTGALGVGGTCFPRDTRAFNFVAQSLGLEAPMITEVDRANRRTAGHVVDVVGSLATPGTSVAVLGLAFKPSSVVTEESQGLKIAAGLRERGYVVHGYDPLAGAAAGVELGDGVTIHDGAASCVAAADVIVVANPDPAFDRLTPAEVLAGRERVTVFDCWRRLSATLDGQRGISYVPLGRGPRESADLDARLQVLWRQAAPCDGEQ